MGSMLAAKRAQRPTSQLVYRVTESTDLVSGVQIHQAIKPGRVIEYRDDVIFLRCLMRMFLG